MAPLPTPPCFQPVNILGQAVWIYLCQARLPGQEQPGSQEANPDVGWNVSRAFGALCGQSAEEAGEEKLHSQLKEKGEPEGPGNRRVLFSISLAQQSLCKFSYVLFGPAANWLPDRTGGRITILTQCYPETAETNKPLQSYSQPFQGSAHLSKACKLLMYLCRDWCLAVQCCSKSGHRMAKFRDPTRSLPPNRVKTRVRSKQGLVAVAFLNTTPPIHLSLRSCITSFRW